MTRAPVRVFVAAALVVGGLLPPLAAQELTLPNLTDSVKFAAMGDNGTGDRAEYDTANQMAAWHDRFPFDFVIMLGDNMYGSQKPADFVQKFERPYRPLLETGVRFYASLGNHDNTSNDAYKPFNMNGQRYYTYAKKNVRFFVLDSNYLDPEQVGWITTGLRDASEPWKIVYFHHRCIRMAGGTAPPSTSESDWSRFLSSTASTSSIPVTTISTNA